MGKAILDGMGRAASLKKCIRMETKNRIGWLCEGAGEGILGRRTAF